MNTTLRWFLRLTFLSSFAILVALACGLGRRVGGEPLRFERDPFVIPEVMQSGKEYDYDAVVVNGSRQPARVIGAGDHCGSSCYSGRGLPAVIEAGGRGHVTVHILACLPGDFSGELIFYTDQPSQPTMTIKLVGKVRKEQSLDGTSHATNP